MNPASVPPGTDPGETGYCRLSRRALLAGALATLPLASCGKSAGAEFSYKIGVNAPETHPATIRARQAIQAIYEDSGGRLEIRMFSNSQLAGDTFAVGQLRSGATELYLMSGLILANALPLLSIYGQPFAFNGYEPLWAALDGELGRRLLSELPKIGLVGVGKIWTSGFRQFVTGAHPVVHPDDLNGLKMRVPISKLWISIFEALGALPTSMNPNELYTALRTRVVDGCEQPLSIVESFKLYEVQRYCALSNYMVDNYILTANGAAWARLPDTLRSIAEHHFSQSCDKERADMAATDVGMRDALRQQGMQLDIPDIPAFKARLAQAGFYGAWRTQYGEQAWSLLEHYAGKLD